MRVAVPSACRATKHDIGRDRRAHDEPGGLRGPARAEEAGLDEQGDRR